MTSRAEYRLLLRQDNADARLTPLGREIGLVSDSRWQRFLEKQSAIEQEKSRLQSVRVPKDDFSDRVLEEAGSTPLKHSVNLLSLMKRPELNYDNLALLDPERPDLAPSVRECVEVDIRYEGYIRLEQERVDRFRKLERRLMPENINYKKIRGIRLEARQKLDERRPVSLGQASRISGVSPADIQVLLVWLEQHHRQTKAK
jgi:tRNA uridine 5-carboxymethylaminomethyl modification enzyme